MADIVSVPAGNFTPGAEFSVETIAAVINAAWNQGNTKADAFSSKIGAATTGFLDATNAPQMVAAYAHPIPNVTEPNITIPSSVDPSGVMTLFDTKYLELVALLADKFALFRTTYYPDEQVEYTAAANWLESAIASGGIPATQLAQLFTDDKDRINAESSKAQSEIVAAFAAKRFPLPPGAAASAVLQIQQAALDKVAESSRGLTKLSVETMRFAVDKLVTCRQIAMSASVDYIKALASGPDMASNLVNVGYDAQSKLISAAASFYNARTEASKLTYMAHQKNAEFEQEANKANQASESQMIEDKLKALLAEAQAIAQMATSLYNNVRASAGTSYGVNGT